MHICVLFENALSSSKIKTAVSKCQIEHATHYTLVVLVNDVRQIICIRNPIKVGLFNAICR